MNKKFILLIISLVLIVSLLVGCATEAPADDDTTTPPTNDAGDTDNPDTDMDDTDNPDTGTDDTNTDDTDTDAVSSASLATDEASFKELISADGNWIVLTDKDLSFEEDLMVEGEFVEGESEKRVLAFAAYLPDNEIDRFSVTTPSLVIKSPNTLLEYGILKGDVYVESEGFTTKDATIEGNLYFATEELQTAFTLDELSEVSGEVSVKDFTE